MRLFLRPILVALLMAFPALGQIPAPQIGLSGNIGCAGFPCVNSGTLVMSSDTNRTMTAVETSAFYIKVTSSVSLTATRNLIAPAGRFPFTIENSTSGGQSIQIIGASGTGVTIPTGQTVSVWNDGTNYVQIGGSGGGSGTVTSFAASNLPPLFTVSVASPTGPAVGQTFNPSNAAQNSVLAGPTSGGSGPYTFQTAPTVSAANMTSFPTLNQNTTGNASTASALASTPSLCSTGQAPTGVLANGNATGCASLGGGGNTTSTSLSTNKVPKANGANSIIDSSITDDGTTVSTAEPIAAPSGAFGTPSAGALAALPSGAHGIAGDESATAGVPASGVDYIRFDASLHIPVYSADGSAEAPLVGAACPTCVTSAASLTNHALVLGSGSQASHVVASLGTTTTVYHGNASADGTFGVVTPSDAAGNTSGSGNFALVTSPTFVTPVLGSATATSLLATGNVDGTAPVTITTGTSATLGGTFKSGYTLNQEATAAAGVAYTLPTATAGLQYCVGNSWNGSAATTGVLTVNTSASGQFIIFTDGTLSATGGNVTSAGAAADFACFVGVDSTHWYFKPSSGVWSKH